MGRERSCRFGLGGSPNFLLLAVFLSFPLRSGGYESCALPSAFHSRIFLLTTHNYRNCDYHQRQREQNKTHLTCTLIAKHQIDTRPSTPPPPPPPRFASKYNRGRRRIWNFYSPCTYIILQVLQHYQTCLSLFIDIIDATYRRVRRDPHVQLHVQRSSKIDLKFHHSLLSAHQLRLHTSSPYRYLVQHPEYCGYNQPRGGTGRQGNQYGRNRWKTDVFSSAVSFDAMVTTVRLDSATKPPCVHARCGLRISSCVKNMSSHPTRISHGKAVGIQTAAPQIATFTARDTTATAFGTHQTGRCNVSFGVSGTYDVHAKAGALKPTTPLS